MLEAAPNFHTCKKKGFQPSACYPLFTFVQRTITLFCRQVQHFFYPWLGCLKSACVREATKLIGHTGCGALRKPKGSSVCGELLGGSSKSIRVPPFSCSSSTGSSAYSARSIRFPFLPCLAFFFFFATASGLNTRTFFFSFETKASGGL